MRRFITLCFFATVGLGVVAVLSALKPSAPQLDSFGEAPNFELTDQHGRLVSASSLAGKIWVANFFFTSCHGPCPVTMQNLTTLSREFQETQGVALVSISSDPEVDTPQRLLEFTSQFPEIRWSLLTGPRDLIVKTSVEGFKLGMAPDPALHSVKAVLVDRKNQIRGYFSLTDADEISRLSTAIKSLLQNG